MVDVKVIIRNEYIQEGKIVTAKDIYKLLSHVGKLDVYRHVFKINVKLLNEIYMRLREKCVLVFNFDKINFKLRSFKYFKLFCVIIRLAKSEFEGKLTTDYERKQFYIVFKHYFVLT